LRSWERRLPKAIGEIEFKREVAFAENRASYVVHARSLSIKGTPKDSKEFIEYEGAQRNSENNIEMYGDRALQSAAATYRRICREAASKRRKETS